MESRVKELRMNRGINQQMLAGIMGVSQQTISKAERNISAISVELLGRLASYFNVTTDYILGLSDERHSIWRINQRKDSLEDYAHLTAGYKELDEHNQRLLMEILHVLKDIEYKEQFDKKL